VNLRDFLQ
jgi:hypothetical protein